MKIVSLLICLILVSTYAIAQNGYTRAPWGSKTWNGPGRPPHWPPPQPEKQVKKKQPVLVKGYNKHKDVSHHPHHHHKFAKKKYILVKEDKPKPYLREVRKKTVIRTRYIPVQRKNLVNYCSGDTLYLRDKTSGEITIKYVSAAQSCR